MSQAWIALHTIHKPGRLPCRSALSCSGMAAYMLGILRTCFFLSYRAKVTSPRHWLTQDVDNEMCSLCTDSTLFPSKQRFDLGHIVKGI